jgi:hypothetical protein
MKKLLFSVITVVTSLLIADNQTYNFGKAKLHPKFLQANMQRNGGIVERNDSFKGKILIVDARDKADTKQLVPVAEVFCKQLKFNLSILANQKESKLSYKQRLTKLNGQIGVFIVEQEDSPALLVAPEEGWAVVNVKALVAGVEKSRLAPLRIQKEVLRALGFICGGMSSQFSVSLAGSITKPSDLDLYNDLSLPADVQQAFKNNLIGFGVTPYQHTTYRQAVKEGWAPAPTNDVQKAIWDKVHAAPKNPMKIEFDPKKGR